MKDSIEPAYRTLIKGMTCDKSKVVKMPINIDYFNGCSDRCDLLQGPCACGASHSIDEWPREFLIVALTA